MLKAEERSAIEEELNAAISQARELQEMLQQDDQEQAAGDTIPARIQVSCQALRTVYRSMRLEHSETMEQSKSNEYEGGVEGNSACTSKCRRLTPKEKQLVDACCDCIIDFIRVERSACLEHEAPSGLEA